jgi:hypothetical protein
LRLGAARHITRGELSRFAGREISRDVIGRLKSYGSSTLDRARRRQARRFLG